jgi:hypothetical protein
MFFHRSQSLSDVRLEAGVYERDAPVIYIGAQQVKILATTVPQKATTCAIPIRTRFCPKSSRAFSMTP